MQLPTSSNDPVLNTGLAHAASDAAAHDSDHEHDHRMFGFLLFLVSEGMLFVGLFVAYLTYRAGAATWPPAGTPELEKFLPAIFTAILISSSGVIYLADRALARNDIARFRIFLGLTTLMGAIFLGGQAYEWAHLEFGLKSGLFGSTFYVLTGFHGMHVFVGLVLQVILFLLSFRKGVFDQSHYGAEAISIYWHFVDVVWIFLFGMLYLL